MSGNFKYFRLPGIIFMLTQILPSLPFTNNNVHLHKVTQVYSHNTSIHLLQKEPAEQPDGNLKITASPVLMEWLKVALTPGHLHLSTY
jgi:hypothetical protein